ncbi:MAG: hypothetical protein HY657_13135 [Acidobacteria bacterium]|nr:hypothetical protein [Acidobacteriota bacterium]
MTVRLSVGGVIVLVLAMAAPAAAQIDIAGEWAARVTEDQPHRGPGAELGDFTGLPINAAARQKANAWDASILSLPERMAQPHPGQYFMRGPGPNMRITKRTDPVTLQLVAYTLEGVFGRDDRIIWMDGRPHPSPNAEHTWEGFSTGRVQGNQLIITTTHMKWGVIQRNGVPASPKSVMTEHFIRHGDYLTLVTIVDDPVYLDEPFIRTSHWMESAAINPDARWLFEVVEETDIPRGWVPHYPFGSVRDDYARRHGIPIEAAQGGKETLYPEYELKLRQMLANPPRGSAP